MDLRIVQFVSALRAAGVRISLAESTDAFRAIEQLGIMDREAFKISLRTTLIKDVRDIPQFEKLFPLFFQTNQPPMKDITQNLTPQEAQQIAQALQQFTQKLRELMEKLLKGQPLTREEMQELDRMVNMDGINDLRYQKQLARRLEQALQFPEVRDALEELMQMLQEMGMDRDRMEQIRGMLEQNQQAMQDQLYQYAGERIVENMTENLRPEDLQGLYNRPFQDLTDGDMNLLHREVQRLAAALRTRLALRLKRARIGQLDLKSTLRTNLKYANVPIELRHRSHTLKPKIVVLCDISTSMRHVSELMLSLLYAVQNQISKTQAFTFIDHLEYITPDFDGKQSAIAVSEVLQRMPSGYYNTDLGHSLEMFLHDYSDRLDYRSTFIIVGDGRNNYNDPQLEIFKNLARRSRATIWLNPESMSRWGVGDSDMLRYARYCSRVFQVGNLAQLSQAIDHLLLRE